MNPKNLTEKQLEMFRYIGGPVDDPSRVFAIEDHEALVSAGLLYLREDGRYDLTGEGEQLYEKLQGSDQPPRDDEEEDL